MANSEDGRNAPADFAVNGEMMSDEVTCVTAIHGALSASERVAGGGSMIENLTCPSGAAAGLNVALPPDDAQHNAA